MKTVPLLDKMRTVVSDDGRIAKFFLMFKGGQHAAFYLQFSKIGLLINAIRNVARVMHIRIERADEVHAAEAAQGMSDAATVVAIGAGRDAESGNRVICLETADNGSFSFNLSPEMSESLLETLRGQGGREHAA